MSAGGLGLEMLRMKNPFWSSSKVCGRGVMLCHETWCGTEQKGFICCPGLTAVEAVSD